MLAVWPLPKSYLLTVGFALLLSAAPLLRGLVYDLPLSVYLLIFCGIFLQLSANLKHLNTRFTRQASMMLLAWLTLLLAHFLWINPEPHYWDNAQHLLPENLSINTFNLANSFSYIGSFLLLSITFFIALCIGKSRHLSIVFIKTFMFGSIAGIIFTFIASTSDRFTSGFSYRHALVNPNHTAHLIALLLLILLWFTHRSLRHFKRHHHWRGFLKLLDTIEIPHLAQALFILFSLLLLLSGLLLTHSRGGLLVAIISLTFMMGIFIIKYYNKHTTRQLIIGLLPLIIIGVGCLFLLSPYGLFFHETLHQEGFALGDRPAIYQRTIAMIASAPLWGVGPGNFPAAFPLFRDGQMLSEGLVNSAHSHYLQLAAELGLIGMSLAIISQLYFLRIFIRGLQHHRERYGFSTLGLSIWLLASLHSLFDFPLQIPGLAAIVLTLLTVCAAQSLKPSKARSGTVVAAAHTRDAPALD